MASWAPSAGSTGSSRIGFGPLPTIPQEVGAPHGPVKGAGSCSTNALINSTSGTGFSGCRARCGRSAQIGRYHDIEVEDDVTAYFEYGNGTTGVFITSTGEAPGTDRLEVTAEKGRVVIENDRFLYTRNEVPMSKFCKDSPEQFSQPLSWNIEIPLGGHGGQHYEVLPKDLSMPSCRANLSSHRPQREFIRLTCANAMLLSSFTDKTVGAFPIDAGAYELLLREKIAASTIGRKVSSVPISRVEDFSKSFKR